MAEKLIPRRINFQTVNTIYFYLVDVIDSIRAIAFTKKGAYTANTDSIQMIIIPKNVLATQIKQTYRMNATFQNSYKYDKKMGTKEDTNETKHQASGVRAMQLSYRITKHKKQGGRPIK